MVFNTEYYTTLDRGYHHYPTPNAEPVAMDFPEPVESISNFTYKEVGTTVDANIHPIQGMNAKIREGAARLEMGFFGTGKGGFGGQNATPEILGKLEREQFRELAKINEVSVSTHASPGFAGLSGFNPRSGKFEDEMIQNNLKEIYKAVEFAGGASTGGAVVFHTGEWQRPLVQAGLTEKDRREGKKEGLFKEYDNEYKKSQVYAADPETGQIIAVGRDEKFYFPKETYDPKTKMWFVDRDSEGRPVVEEKNYDEAIQYIRDKHKGEEKYEKMGEVELAVMAKYEQKLKNAEGDALRFSFELAEWQKDLGKVIESKKFYKDLWDNTPEKDRWQLMKEFSGRYGKYVPSDIRNPADFLAEQEKELKEKIRAYQSTSTSAQEQYEGFRKLVERIKPLEEVGIERTAKGVAKAGMKAMFETDKNRKELNEPIFISPESYEPSTYGAHPDEIRNIITKSRQEMTNMLTKQGYSRHEAEEKAKQHIKGTLDSGHFNMWRQHFQAKEGENPAQTSKRFEKWYIGETEKMFKNGLIGQIHLSDNWGYDDEHLTAGQGNIPLKEFIKLAEKHGIKNIIAERGSFNGPTILPDTLAAIGSPVYSLGRRISFNNIRNAHFGYAAPANYIVGAYAPSNEWRLWSEVPLE
jgi:hypothetical protein